ncbi:MAG: M50 family metallopeptidase [Deltaproteobacteria bacterium]|nr:M50 family metallopeptidase [Deltaproteobacteria bacterium]
MKEVPLASRGTQTLHTVGLIALAVLMLLFWHHRWLLPVKMFVVLAHELGHALAALLTGGSVLEVSFGTDQGGWARTQGGNAFIILNAGYLGSTLTGLALLRLGRTPRASRIGLSAIALLLVGVAVFLMSWLSMAQVYAVLMAAAFLLLGRFAGAGLQRFVLRALGMFSVLYALWDIADDVFTPAGSPMSDAAALAQLTYVPSCCWGVTWIALSVGLVVLFRRRLL